VRRPAAFLVLSAMVPALLVVPTFGRSAADPHPVAPRLSTVQLTGVDAAAWRAEQAHPAAADSSSTPAATDLPEVFTARTATASYSLVGVTWDGDQSTPVSPDDVTVSVRTRSGGAWQDWTSLDSDSGDGPAEGEGVVPVEGSEGLGKPARVGTSPYYAGPSDGIQVRVDTASGTLPAGLRVDLVDPGVSDADSRLVASVPSEAQAAAGKPAVISRSQWGADESLRNGSATYEPRVRVAFVHHTATSNSYTKAQAAAAVRSIYAYDTNSLGWSDIAYNVLVDKFGQVFEGRAGGLDRDVRSGATGGFNAQSWAVSALGNYDTDTPSTAMVTSLEKILAYKLGLEHLNPAGTATLTAANGSGTTAKYSDGTKVSFKVISGHRDAGSTACPGAKLYALLPTIRTAVASLMGAQLYSASAAPLVVAKGATTPVRVKAYAMTAQSWRLEVRKQGSTTVLRTVEGSAAKGGLIDQSWDLKDSGGKQVAAGIYTVTLQSWSGTKVAVPYAVNVSLFADPNIYPRPADGVFHLEGRGYGHGHGMSQFGAEGAARQGLTAAQIVAFYYPGTTMKSIAPTTTMRVSLSLGVRTTTSGQDVRLRPAAGLQVSEGTTTAVLPTTLGGKAVTSWRTYLLDGTLGLYGWTGDAYQPLPGWTGRAGPFRFTTAPTASTTSRVTLIRNTGAEVVYRGVVEARRSASKTTLYAVSEVLVDDYVKSVVSAEMPGGWTTAAYQAQAIAARSYGLFKRAAAVTAGSAWHICDTTSCQVYNGYTGETAPESKAATATSLQYLTYAGAPIFAEFGSADGGWTSDGGKPYLVAKADPYDGVVTGTANWGHAWTKDVTASAIQAAYPSIGSIERIVITDRVDDGEWGGRVKTVRLEGSKADVTVSGTALRSALGFKSEWFRAALVAPAPPPVVIPTAPPAPSGPPPSAVRSLQTTVGDRAAGVTWTAPNTGASALTGYRVTVSPGSRVIDVPAATTTLSVDKLVNGRVYSVSVVARSATGSSKAATALVTPTSKYGYQVSVPATVVFGGALARSTAKVVPVLGHAAVPSKGVSLVTLRVTARSTTGSGGWIHVAASGTTPAVAQQSVPSTGTSTNLLMVAPGTGGAVTLEASTGVSVTVEVVGYQTLAGAVGQRVVPVTPAFVTSGPVTTSVPLTALVAGRAGIPVGAPAALLQATVSAGPTSTTVRLSPDGTAAHAVPVVTVPAGQTVTVPVVVPLAANGTVRVLGTGIGAYVSLDAQAYYLTDDGLAGSGRMRALTPARVYDSRTAPTAPAAMGPGTTLTVPVLGHGGVPASGVSAVVLNVLAYKPTTSGSVTVYPAGTARPSTRAVSYDHSGTVRTTVVVKVGAGGAIVVYLPWGGADVLIDVTGYVTS
jgi:SpoIID/LytB domain protein